MVQKKALDFKNSEKPGAVYIGSLPFGFYDSELRNYLQQFGDVTKMNVVRSKKTGKPLGYAFVQFRHENVAKIVAKTMNNYLMFKKLLKCEFINHEEIGRNMFAVNNNNTPELCKGTTRREKNQSWLEKPRGRKFVNKQKLKVLRTLKKMESLGLDIDSNHMLTKREDLEKIAKKIKQRKLEKDNVSSDDASNDVSSDAPGKDNPTPEKQTSMSTGNILPSSTGKKLAPTGKKNKVDKSVKSKPIKKLPSTRVSPLKRKAEMADQVDGSNSGKKRSVNENKLNTAKKPSEKSITSPVKKSAKKIVEQTTNTKIEESTKTKKHSKNTKKTQTSPAEKSLKKNRKLTMSIEEVDEEIIIKTPPNVVKKVKTGKQTVICDASASTVLKTGKRSVLEPLDSVAQDLFVGKKKKSSPGRFVKSIHGRKRSLTEDKTSVRNKKVKAGVQGERKQK